MNPVMDEGKVAGPLTLDPFSFHGYTSSVVKGIGGQAPNADPSYAFHTEYVRLARGRAHFAVTFTDLHARQGTLVLRVHLLPDEPGSVASMVTSERIQLNRLVQNHGHIEVSFEAFRGATYALMGLVAGETDASATGVRVTADRPYDAAEDVAGARGDGLPTRFGDMSNFRTTAHIISLDSPTLTQPVSQIATPDQFLEPIFENWRQRLAPASEDIFDHWSLIYLLQALSTYGMIEKGAKGLIIGPIDRSFIDLAIACGCNLTILDRTDPGPLPVGAEYRHAGDLSDFMSEDLFDFDFLGSCHLGDRFDTVGDVDLIMHWAFKYLRPMGMAVHVVGTGSRSPHFKRSELERLALNFLSSRHDVGQFRLAPYHPSFDQEPGAAGFIVRRAAKAM